MYRKWRQRIYKLFSKSKRKRMLAKCGNLQKKDITIFSSNCVGGVIYNEFGLQFASPTINMFFYAEDFLKFVENWQHYVSCELIEVNSTQPYPIVKLDDILLHLVHYKNADDAIQAWKRRCARINLDNIVVMMVDRDGFYEGLLERIDRLPYPKVLFTSKKYDYSWCCLIPDFRDEPYVGIITGFADLKGYKYFDKYFDVIGFLNEGRVSK